MTNQEIATKLVDYCRQGKYEEAQNELYAQDVESFEPAHSPMPYAKGLDALKEKGVQFQNSVEQYHGGTVSDPLVAGNFITLTMGMDVTLKGMGRMNMEEVCVYEVKDGKIVKETFYF